MLANLSTAEAFHSFTHSCNSVVAIEEDVPHTKQIIWLRPNEGFETLPESHDNSLSRGPGIVQSVFTLDYTCDLPKYMYVGTERQHVRFGSGLIRKRLGEIPSHRRHHTRTTLAGGGGDEGSLKID